jgi:hypothetical protein
VVRPDVGSDRGPGTTAGRCDSRTSRVVTSSCAGGRPRSKQADPSRREETTISRYRKLIPAIAGAAILLLAACSDDNDDGAQPPGLGGGGDDLELETTVPEDGAAAAPGADDDAAAGGDAQAFCDWFTSVGPVPEDWDVQDMPTPPAEIADAFNAIVQGDTDLSLQSEVTRWVTANCF